MAVLTFVTTICDNNLPQSLFQKWQNAQIFNYGRHMHRLASGGSTGPILLTYNNCRIKRIGMAREQCGTWTRFQAYKLAQLRIFYRRKIRSPLNFDYHCIIFRELH